MKIVLWIVNDPIQKALANKINDIYPIAGIVLENRKIKRKITLKKIIEKLIEKIFLPSIDNAWWGLHKYYDKQYPSYPNTKIIEVEDINSQEAYDFTTEINPCLICVSGTRLVKEKMLSIEAEIGIINLHTGLSPYIKGGPNCTNWCIATKQYHLIGNTIMWIDKGIDSGDILTTSLVPISHADNLFEIHKKVIEHANNLYVKAIEYLMKGGKTRIKQNTIATGKTYYNKQWGLKEKINLILNLKDMRKKIKNNQINELQKTIKIIEIP